MIQLAKKLIKNSACKLIKSNTPDFLIIGAQKAGTTSLHYNLHQHPLFIGAQGKELAFFSNDYNYKKNQTWYHSNFKDIRRPFPDNNTLFFESTPEYIYNKTALERIYNYNKNIKLVLMLREPVSRAYSAWNMFRDFKSRPNGIPESLYTGYIEDKENNIYKELYSTDSFPTFNETIESEFQKIDHNSSFAEPSFVRRGIYFEQIKFLFSLFEETQVLILDFNELQSSKAKTLNKILNFLGKENYNWDANLSLKSYNKRPYKDKIDEMTKQQLKAFYKPYNEELYKLIGKKFDW